MVLGIVSQGTNGVLGAGQQGLHFCWVLEPTHIEARKGDAEAGRRGLKPRLYAPRGSKWVHSRSIAVAVRLPGVTLAACYLTLFSQGCGTLPFQSLRLSGDDVDGFLQPLDLLGEYGLGVAEAVPLLEKAIPFLPELRRLGLQGRHDVF